MKRSSFFRLSQTSPMLVAFVAVAAISAGSFLATNHHGASDLSAAKQTAKTTKITTAADGSVVESPRQIADGQTSLQTAPQKPAAQPDKASAPVAPATDTAKQDTARAPAKSAAPSSYTPPAATPAVITGISATAGSVFCSAGQTYRSYSYSVNYNTPNTGASRLYMGWEAEALDGRTMTVGLPEVVGIGNAVRPNTVQYSDNSADYPYQTGLQISLSYGYRARLYAFAPNSAYSNWIIIPAGRESC